MENITKKENGKQIGGNEEMRMYVKMVTVKWGEKKKIESRQSENRLEAQ